MALRPITKAEALAALSGGAGPGSGYDSEPGFGGQAFMTSQLDTIRQVRALIEKYNPSCELEVDGGISPRPPPWWWRRGPMCWWPDPPCTARRTSPPPFRPCGCERREVCHAGVPNSYRQQPGAGPAGHDDMAQAGWRTVQLFPLPIWLSGGHHLYLCHCFRARNLKLPPVFGAFSSVRRSDSCSIFPPP